MYVENRHKKTAHALTSEAVFLLYQSLAKGSECNNMIQANGMAVNSQNTQSTTNYSGNCTTDGAVRPNIDNSRYVQPDMKRAALWYARKFGWQIFPLRPGTKEPFGGVGVYHATNDIDQIRAWWQRWPRANIGLHCGGSGILGLDADEYKNNYTGSGLSPAAQETVTSLTGSGGTHLLYAMPADVRFGNATGKLPAGIDIRGWGGYFVLPPSLHPNGTRYAWELDYGPHEMALAPLPQSLWEILRSYTISDAKTETTHPARIAQAVALVERALVALDIPATGPAAYMSDGRRWALNHCPFMPEDDPHDDDRGPFVLIFPDGRITAGCQHNRCRQAITQSGLSGWRWLRQRAGLGAGAWHDAAIDALLASLEVA